MSAFKGTPGPWVVAFRADGSSYVSMGDPMAGQHKQFDLMLVAGNGNDEDDARLIAAAPCMYDFVRRAAESGDPEATSILEAINGRS